MSSIWLHHQGDDLRQGDILERCAIPVLSPEFSVESVTDEPEELGIESRRLIVITQSCDLENSKAPFVALCPLHTLEEMENVDAQFWKQSKWEEVRRGRIEGLYMLPSPQDPALNRQALVADFRMIVSLPIGYLTRRAHELAERPRLQSPYVEHFSQSFARFFMRVGLPSQIPPFTK